MGVKINPLSVDSAYNIKRAMVGRLCDVLYDTARNLAKFYVSEPIETWDYDETAGPRAGRIKFRAGLDGGRLYSILTTQKLAKTRALFDAIPAWDLPADPIVSWDGVDLVIEGLFPDELQIKKTYLDRPGDGASLRVQDGRSAFLGLTQDWEYATLTYRNRMEAHALIVGTTGSGKTTTIKAIMAQLARGDNARIAIIDPKGGFDGLEDLANLKGLVGPIAYTERDAMAVARWCTQELHRRDSAEACAVPIHITVDEFQEVMKIAEFSDMFETLCRMGRSKNIHLTFATQRPDKNMWGKAGKAMAAQFSNVLLHALNSYKDVMTVTGNSDPPAHLLAGEGDIYYKNKTDGTQRVQVAMLTEYDYKAAMGEAPGNAWAARDVPDARFSCRQVQASLYIAGIHDRNNQRGGRGSLQTLLEEIGESENGNEKAADLLKVGRETYHEFKGRLQ